MTEIYKCCEQKKKKDKIEKSKPDFLGVFFKERDWFCAAAQGIDKAQDPDDDRGDVEQGSDNPANDGDN